MNEIDVRKALGTIDVPKVKRKSEIRYAKWDAEKAFNRLNVSRETLDFLVAGINENASGLPLETREMYDEVIELLKKIEAAEINTIKYGE